KKKETVLAGTAGIFAFHDIDLLTSEGNPCIKCGRCLDACPLKLFVTVLISDKHSEILKCIECGACQYICPAGRPLMQKIRELKEELQDG
ncbi:MAG: 4Fe-4S dicluster domain-containing protein, partial [Gammaproteobacteria bacterium]|nr:4Fe-4S dicluster domain-containing protein [Gammaproteobacteria bacterium]